MEMGGYVGRKGVLIGDGEIEVRCAGVNMEMDGYGGIKRFLIGGGERETPFICLFVIISLIK